MSTNIKDLLSEAESFISGFEDDPDQKGISGKNGLLEKLREAIAAPDPRVVIVMDGGLVHDIYADVELRVTLIDYDTEGSDEDDLTMIEELEADKKADVRKPVADVCPDRIDKMLVNVEE